MCLFWATAMCVCVCVCVRAPMCTVHVWVPFPLRCFSISPVRAGIAALLSILLELRTDRSPINLSSTNHVRRRGGTWEVWQRWTLGRGGRRGERRVVTHSSLGRRPALCVRVYVYACVWDKKRVSRWSPDGNCLGWTTASKREGDMSLYSLSLSLSLPHTLTHIQQTMRVMGDNGADTNKSAPLGLGPWLGLRKQTVCPTHKPKHNTPLHTQQTEGPVTLTVQRSVSRGTHLLLNDIYTSGIHCG